MVALTYPQHNWHSYIQGEFSNIAAIFKSLTSSFTEATELPWALIVPLLVSMIIISTIIGIHDIWKNTRGRKNITNRKEDNDNFKYQVAFVTNKTSPSDNISNKVGGSRVWTSSYPKSSYTTSYWAPFLRLIEKSSTRKILRTISVEMKHLPISSSGEFSQIAKSWGVMGRVVGLGGVNLTIDRAAVGISEGWPLAYSLLGRFYYE